MDKALDMLALLYRLILGIGLALCIVCLSIHRPSSVYEDAKSDINLLQQGVGAVNDQVTDAFSSMYQRSALKNSTIAWLRHRGSSQSDVRIDAVPLGNLRVPDADVDPLVTLDSQVKWADRIYLDDDSPLYLCTIRRTDLFHAYNRIVGNVPKPSFARLTVFLSRAEPEKDATVRCVVQLGYDVHLEKMSGTRSAILEVPSAVTAISDIPGLKSWDTDLAFTLKDNGLGDMEDSMFVVLPNVEQFWSEIGNKTPAAAIAWLDAKNDDEIEKSKEKIDILGESLNGSLTIMLTCLIELGLMLYLFALLRQVHLRLPECGNQAGESQFFGVLASGTGRAVVLGTAIFGITVVEYSLFRVLPFFTTQWPGPAWQMSLISRTAVGIAFLVAGVTIVIEARSIVNAIRALHADEKTATPIDQADSTDTIVSE